MSQPRAEDTPVSLGVRVTIYAVGGTLKGIVRDLVVFQWAFTTIVHSRLLSLAASLLTVWAYEVVAQRYLEARRRQWDWRSVTYTLSALLVLRAAPAYAIIMYAAEKPSDLVVGGVITAAGNAAIWLSDRFAWLERLRALIKGAVGWCAGSIRRIW